MAGGIMQVGTLVLRVKNWNDKWNDKAGVGIITRVDAADLYLVYFPKDGLSWSIHKRNLEVS
jgi:hypothetical protein